MKFNRKILFLNLILLILISSNLAFAQGNKTITMSGTIVDAISHDGVTAAVIVSDETGKRIGANRSNASDGGAYTITGLYPGKNYVVEIRTQNYFKEKYQLNLANTTKYDNISRDYIAKPIGKNVKIPLPVPPFESNKSKRRFGANDILDDYASTLINNPEVKFELQCYPDNNLNKTENKTLTEERCNTLMSYFTSHGINALRISIKASEKTDPSNPPPSEKTAKGKKYIGSTYIVVISY